MKKRDSRDKDDVLEDNRRQEHPFFAEDKAECTKYKRIDGRA